MLSQPTTGNGFTHFLTSDLCILDECKVLVFVVNSASSNTHKITSNHAKQTICYAVFLQIAL